MRMAGVGAALVALVAWSFWLRWQVLAASPFPLGVDGYFYPIQLRSLLEHGTLHYPAAPLAFWFMVPFAAITDPIAGAKLGAALGGALIALPAYALGARFGKRRGAGLVAAALATTSAGSTFLSIEFVKQGIGLTVALAALWLVLRALDQITHVRVALAIAGVVAVLLTHKLAAALVIAISIAATVEAARARGSLRGRRLLFLLLGIVAVALVALVLGIAMPQRFLSPTDIALFGNLLTRHAHWSAPAMALPKFTLTLGYEAAIGAVVAIAAAFALYFHRPKPHRAADRVAAWSCVVLAIAIGLPWLAVDDLQGLGFRLRTAAFVPLSLCAATLVGALAPLAKQWREPALVVIAIVLALRGRHIRNEGRVIAHPALVAAAMAVKIPPGKTAIIPERHIMFMVAWYARAEVSLRPEPVPYARRVRLMPLAFIGMDSPLDQALDAARRTPGIEPPLGFHPRHRNGLVLVSEQTWEWILGGMPPAVMLHLLRWPTI